MTSIDSKAPTATPTPEAPEELLNLYRFRLYKPRMGTLTGIFTATQAQIDAAVGLRCYFGEALGKHSEVCCTFSADLVTKIDKAPPEFVVLFEELGLANGYDPLNYIEDEVIEDDEDSEDSDPDDDFHD